MPRRERPIETKRSEHWLRVAVNDRTSQTNEMVKGLFGWPISEGIEWRSPVKSDDYAEYYDSEFLARLGIDNLGVSLNQFWPNSGPRWDGLATTDSGKIILVEAKAYVGEMISHARASPKSLRKIRAAIEKTKDAFGASADCGWESPFYQYANRLAHLYFLRELNSVDAYLLFVYFADAPDVPAAEGCSIDQWMGATRLVEKALGLGSHPYSGYAKSLILPAFHAQPP
ncbi:hypothetical protein ACVWZ4_003799 [Bradyrhizobium sp. USDA 4472]